MILFKEVWRRLRLGYYRMALSEMNPTHPDVPDVVMSIQTLEDEDPFK